MSWLSSFFHPEKGYEKGQEQLDKYYNQSQGYLQPYNQYGQDAHTDINTAMHSLLNPEELQNKWTQNYSESPQAKQAEAMAQERGLNAASSMGLMGSNTALDAIQSGTTQIGLNDRQRYIDDLMQKYIQGTGIGQNIFNQGAGIAGQQGQNAINMGNSSAEMAYGKENAGGNALSGLIGQGIGLAGSALGGGKWNPNGGRKSTPKGGID